MYTVVIAWRPRPRGHLMEGRAPGVRPPRRSGKLARVPFAEDVSINEGAGALPDITFANTIATAVGAKLDNAGISVQCGHFVYSEYQSAALSGRNRHRVVGSGYPAPGVQAWSWGRSRFDSTAHRNTEEPTRQFLGRRGCECSSGSAAAGGSQRLAAIATVPQ